MTKGERVTHLTALLASQVMSRMRFVQRHRSPSFSFLFLAASSWCFYLFAFLTVGWRIKSFSFLKGVQVYRLPLLCRGWYWVSLGEINMEQLGDTAEKKKQGDDTGGQYCGWDGKGSAGDWRRCVLMASITSSCMQNKSCVFKDACKDSSPAGMNPADRWRISQESRRSPSIFPPPDMIYWFNVMPPNCWLQSFVERHHYHLPPLPGGLQCSAVQTSAPRTATSVCSRSAGDDLSPAHVPVVHLWSR